MGPTIWIEALAMRNLCWGCNLGLPVVAAHKGDVMLAPLANQCDALSIQVRQQNTQLPDNTFSRLATVGSR